MKRFDKSLISARKREFLPIQPPPASTSTRVKKKKWSIGVRASRKQSGSYANQQNVAAIERNKELGVRGAKSLQKHL